MKGSEVRTWRRTLGLDEGPCHHVKNRPSARPDRGQPDPTRRDPLGRTGRILLRCVMRSPESTSTHPAADHKQVIRTRHTRHSIRQVPGRVSAETRHPDDLERDAHVSVQASLMICRNTCAALHCVHVSNSSKLEGTRLTNKRLRIQNGRERKITSTTASSTPNSRTFPRPRAKCTRAASLCAELHSRSADRHEN